MAEVVPGYTDVKEDLTFNPNGPKYQMNVGMEYQLLERLHQRCNRIEPLQILLRRHLFQDSSE